MSGQKKQINFDTDSILKMLLVMSAPTIIAQFVNALYSLVDRMYIGHLEEIGATALTSVGITFPILQAVTAFSLLVGMGGGPLLSIALGEQKRKEAGKLIGNAFALLCVIGIALTVICYWKAEELLLLFGANQITLGYGSEYLKAYSLGILPSMIVMGMTPFLNAQGETKLSTWVIILGAIINIVLDPVFIFYFDMGVRGAAFASDIAQICCSVFTIILLTKRKRIWVPLQLSNIRFRLKRSLKMCSLGVSSFAFNINESLFQIFINLLIRNYAGYGVQGDLYIGSMTIICSLYQIFYMPLKGVVQAAQPLVGYYYGAGNIQKLKTTIRYARYATVTFATVSSLAIVSFPNIFISIFSNDENLTNASILPVRLAFSLAFAFGFQMISQHMFIAIGEAKLSFLFAMLRKVILLMPIALLLSYFGGIQMVYFAEPVATVITMILTQISFDRYLKKLSAFPE